MLFNYIRFASAMSVCIISTYKRKKYFNFSNDGVIINKLIIVFPMKRVKICSLQSYINKIKAYVNSSK